MHLPLQKEDFSIAEEMPLNLHTNPQKSKINIFIAESFKNLEIIQQMYDKSYGVKDQDLLKESTERVGLNRKMSERSDSYHRVTNSRKIKTKRTTKQNIPRSEYFYFHQMDQNGEEGSIEKLLNDYENFHQMILNNDFSAIENSVIKLSHYGNKKKTLKSREASMGKTDSKAKNNQSFYDPAMNGRSNQRKPLSRSTVVPDVQLKKSVVLGTTQDRFHPYQQTNNSTQSRKHPVPTRDTLSKYTTPIRTIYLNKSQQSPQYLNSSSNKLSSSTPLRNNRPYLTGHSNRVSSSILEKEVIENKRFHQIQPQNSTKVKLSVVSCQKKWKTISQVENAQFPQFTLPKAHEVYLSKYHSQLFQPSPHQKPYPPSENINPIQITTSVMNSNRQSKSRSSSKKGLTLTQSASKIVNSNSQFICPKSRERLSHNNIEREKDILARKLDQKGLLQSKRVEIRIY